MTYLTRCACSEAQLVQVGCECDRSGPVRLVKTDEDYAREFERAYLERKFREEEAEAEYWEEQLKE